MNRSLSLGLMAVGAVLIVYGLIALDSGPSNFSRFFTGSPTDRTMWLLIGGVFCAIAGGAGLSRRSK